ncbi:sigma-70 family RNA polymerase sigma factor, partial [Streptomyces sp. RS10V-4]|uniref:RNA polymerase sigma factor n=1 Tax=Streptomyces rhizoryzae TaxID=2932493 RepID=UPI00200504B6
MSPEHEAAVITTAQAGDRCAQDELVARYLPLVYNIVGRALHGHADVDDVVQETMLRALDGLAGLRKPHRFGAWLVAVTMNEIRRHWRSKQASASVTGIDAVTEVADPGADFVDLTIIRLGLSGQRREVAEATRWLDEDDRALLALWWLEAAGELTRPEMAAALKLPSSYVAVRVQRMKAQLEASRLVVRALSATSRCPRLKPVVARWDGMPSALWRKRISRHVRDCRDCSGRGNGLIPAQSLLAGIALVPPAASLACHAARAGHAAATGLAGSSVAAAPPAPLTTARHAAPRPHGLGRRPLGGHRRPRLRPRRAHVLAGGAAATAAATAVSVMLGSPDSIQSTDSSVAPRPVLVKAAPIPSPPPRTLPPSHPPTTFPGRTSTAEPSPAHP